MNKPGHPIAELEGGVAGGSILKGVLKMNQEIEFRPGVVTKTSSGPKCKPLKSRIVSLMSEKNPLQFAVPGGLIAVGTKLDPTLTRADKLVGNVGHGFPGNGYGEVLGNLFPAKQWLQFSCFSHILSRLEC